MSRVANPPTPAQTGKPALLFIPAAPPKQGHGGAMVAGMVGAGAALIAVAAFQLPAKPKTSGEASSSRAEPERIYVPVPVLVHLPAEQAPFDPSPAPSPAPMPAGPAHAAAARAAEPPRTAETAVKRSDQITVPYRGQDARTQRILVPITVNGRATVTMALDTGAPATLISQGLADHLGILRADEGKLLSSASGIGGSAPAVLVVLDSLALGPATDQFVPATVTASLLENFEGLLGMDFITTFKLKIDSAQQVLILTLPQSDSKTPAGHGEHWWRRLFRQFSDQRKRWEMFRDAIDQRVAKSQISEGAGMENLKQVRVLADNQAQEAEKLLNRLDRHASNHSVPREWR
ncbi:MAG TPA: retropepsin-like aspartic protease [Polyangia bacterium]